MSLLTDLEERLKAGGWTLLRKSKHQIWLHPVTRQTMTIPIRPKDTPAAESELHEHHREV